ncbi:tetratricopeptide repeat protein [Treponema sp.]|uniref:tetratricopeptide repeat protein n=1 Tax=Treponema sp. TaxID=166 RepID=UPI003F017764
MKTLKICFCLLLGMLPCFFCCTSIPYERSLAEKNLFEEYFSLAEAYKKIEKYEKAVVYYEKSLASESFHKYAFYEIAVCNVYLKNWEKAAASFNELLENDPENITLKSSLAYIEAMRGNLAGAQTLYSALYEENPDDSSVLKNLILVLIAQKNYTEASEKLVVFEERFPYEDSLQELKKAIPEDSK